MLVVLKDRTVPLLPGMQEIAGHEEMVGQYESYKSFTMPHLYRVVEVGGWVRGCRGDSRLDGGAAVQG